MKHLSIAVAACLLTMACGDSTTAEGGGGADDGKLHPEGNGVEVDETPACERLHTALLDEASALACVATFATCDNFIASLSGASCAIYDDGSLDGCTAYYGEATDCDDSKLRAEGCIPATLGLTGCAE